MLLPVSILVDVALRKESVDRNLTLTVRNVPIDVALRKESVDRNLIDEIQLEFNSVALRKESVDRNVIGFIAKNANSMSLSARRAWIEIPQSAKILCNLLGRSPQGERG